MNCHKCGRQISGKEEFCSGCGTKITKGGSKPNITCPICETLNPPDAEICAVCGESLPKEQHDTGFSGHSNQVFCRYCGTANPKHNKYCSKCGKLLKGEPRAYTPPAPTPAPTPSDSGSSLPLIIGLSIAAVLCVVIALVVVACGNNTNTTPTPTPTIEITQEPTPTPTPAPTPTPVPTPRPTPIDIVEHDTAVTYSTYEDYTYSFSCPYPSGFYKTSTVSDFTRYCLKANDSSGFIYICGTENDTGLDVATVSKNFKSSYNHNDVVYDEQGYNYCSVLITNGYHYNYCYYNLSGGKIRGFEMQFDVDKYNDYIDYISYMQSNLSLY